MIFTLSNILANFLMYLNIVMLLGIIFNLKIKRVKIMTYALTMATISSTLVYLRNIHLDSSTGRNITTTVMIVLTVLLTRLILNIKWVRVMLSLVITLMINTIIELGILLVLNAKGINIAVISSLEQFDAALFLGLVLLENALLSSFIYAFKMTKIHRIIIGNRPNRTLILIIGSLMASIFAFIYLMFGIVISGDSTEIIRNYAFISVISLTCTITSVWIMLNVDIKEEKIRMQEEHNEILSDLKHKFNGIISIVTSYVESKDLEALQNYVEELNGVYIRSIKNIPTNITNSQMFYLLASKAKEAEQKGVKFKINVPFSIDSLKGINQINLIYTMNELISNAIDHGDHSNESIETQVTIENQEDYLKLSVSNPVKEGYLEQPKPGRGKGLKQIMKCIGDSDEIHIENNGSRFEVVAVFGK